MYSTELGFNIALTMAHEHEEHIINHVTDFYIVASSPANAAALTAGEITSRRQL